VSGAIAEPRVPAPDAWGRALALSVEESELAVGPAGSAGFDSVGEGPQCFVSADAAGPFACVPAAADVDLYGGRVPVEAYLEEPVGWGGPCFDAALPFLFPLLGVGDCPADVVEGEGEPGLQGAES